jgi:small conductance mechanosensitive channel
MVINRGSARAWYNLGMEKGFWEHILDWLTHNGWEILLTLVVSGVLYWLVGQVVDWSVGRVNQVKHRGKQPRSEIRKRNRTIGNLVMVLARAVIVATALFMVLMRCGVDVTPLIAATGILGVALGFGTQSLVKDALTGLFIIMENQYRVGDYIEAQGTGIKEAAGTVEKISLRTTKLRDREGNVHFVPNGSIVQVSNKTLGYGKVHFEFEVGTDVDIDGLTEVVNEVGEKLARDAKWKEKILEPPHFVEISDFGKGVVAVTVSGKTLPADQWLATSEFRKRLLEALDTAKIEVK